MAGALVLSLGAGLITAPVAFASNGPADSNWPASTPKPAPTAEQKAVEAALAQAKSSGKRVVIEHLTTGNSQTFANPAGTLTVDAASAPERVKQANGSWRAIDTTLKVNADGSISPAVVPSPLSISGGGSGPMATMTSADGKKLAFKTPFKLPKPVLEGNDAHYKNVLPDVDLRLTATQLGGWSQVLIVRTAQAAANPALKKIRLGVDAPGLKTTADAAGNISFNDAQGKARFTSPTSFMWDSTKKATPEVAAGSGKSGKSAAASGADAPASSAPAAADRVLASTPDGPGDTANVKPIGVKADATGIDLIPDTSLLGQGTGPWYIDPGVNPSADSANQAWSQVQEAYPDTNEFNGTADGQSTPAAGYCGYSTCTRKGRERAYFQIGINTGIHGAEVLDARLYATVVSSSSPSTATPMGLYHSPTGISSPTSWNRQPCDKNSRMGGCSKIGGATISGTGEIQYNVTGQMKNAAAGRWSTFTFGFAPDDEGNMYYRQRFSNTPHIVTTYDFTPHIGNPRTSPTPGFAGTGTYSACTTPGAAQPWDNPGWIGANTNVHLTSETWSPTGRQLQTTFQIWDDDAAGASVWHQTGWNGSAGDAVVNAGTLIEGHQYGWTSRTTDDTLTSTETPWCFFRVDRTPPSASVTSTDFPLSGTTGGHPKKVDEEGTFTLAGADNAPITGTNRSSGLACARWTTDPVKAASDWNCTDTDTQIVKTFTNGKATIKYTPRAWGTNYLYLQTQDNAGNMSQPVVHSFYVPSNPNSPAPIFGDINGDKKADVVLADSAGNIRQINGGGDPASSPVALARSSVSGNGWNGIQLTHRGSLGNKNVDDLLAHEPGKPNLYNFTNNNTGLVDGQAPISVAKPGACAKADFTAIDCAAHGYGTNWTNVTQIAAYGSVTGDSKAGQPNSLPQSSLLFVENGRLWLAIPGATNQLDSPAILLSANDTKWDGYELITPGRAKGTNFPTLWARNKTDGGTLHAFSLTGGTPDAPVLTAATNPAAGLITGKIDPARYPRVGSDGDLTGDNIPDLWAVDQEQQLVAFNGIGNTTSGHPAVTGVTTTFTLQGNLNTPTHQWKLNSAAAGKTPSAGGNKTPGTIAGAVTFPTATIEGRSTPYAAFGGAGATITASGTNTGVDTRKDFTISVWAKHGSTTPGPTTSMIVSQDGTNNSSFMIYGDKNTGQWHFAMANAPSGGWPYDYTSVANQNARWTADAWTRLTAVYEAGSGLMSLYVNGVLASTGHHAANTSPAPSGSIVFGRYKVSGAPSDVLNGGVSNFAAYPYAAAPTAPATAGRISMTAAPGFCADNDYARTDDHNPIQIAGCNGTAAQNFEVRGDGSLRIQGKCVSAANAGTGNTTPLELMACGGTPTPAQIFVPRADGSIYNPASGRCMDLGNFDTTPGRQLWLYDCNSSDAQRWTVMSLGTAPLPIPTLDAAP